MLSPPRPFVSSVAMAGLLVLLHAGSLAGQSADIVLYASDASAINGNWARLTSSTGAEGLAMTSADRGWATLDAPLASPVDYFEARFEATGGVAYRLWLRLRGAADSKYNESVWVQFSNGVQESGAPLWRIGTTSALLVNLENCNGCGISGWGWQDNAYWRQVSSVVRFAASGPQTIRVQTREDGVSVDQIVLSPSTFATVAPGAVKDDTTIVPKSPSGSSVSLVRAPYVQQVGRSYAALAWATREAGPATVRLEQGGVVRTVPAQSRLFGAAATGLTYDYYQHEAWLEGLTPSTTYTYDVLVGGIDATPSADTFRTAPAPGSGTVTFIAFGDSGTGSAAQRQLAGRMASEAFDFAVHTGDVAYGNSSGTGGASYRQYDAWFFTIYPWLRSRAMFPSIGNHDNEIGAARAYRDVFVLPRNGAGAAYPDHAERYYSFDYGPVHVVVLDTETAFQDPARRDVQLDWLDQDLATTAQPWKVAVFHRSPYSSGDEHGSDLAVRGAFSPLFERYGVQLVLSGHEHLYERSRPLMEHSATGAAVTYVVTGGGGGPLYGVGSGAWTAAAASEYHYVRVSAGTGCSMSVRAVGIDGTTIDEFSIERCTPPLPEPWPIPGTIEAEDFDEGANGSAYFDQDAGNRGGQYRSTDVDIERCGEGGHNVGWIAEGEWLRYTVRVAAAGQYVLEARIASTVGGSFHAEFGGVNKTGSIGVPVTGGWQAWRTVSRFVTLASGTQVMRLVFEAAGFNVNHVRLRRMSGSTPFGGSPRPLPGTVQSEDFDEGGEGVAYHDTTAVNSGGQYRTTGVDVERSGDAGGGFNVGWAGAGEWLNYTVEVSATGAHRLLARVACPGAGGTFHVELDGTDVTGPVRVPATGSWQVYQDVTVPVQLSAGPHALRLVLDTNGYANAVGNFNYIRVY